MLHHRVQRTTDTGPLSREKRCCITVGYKRNALVSVAMQHNMEVGDERDVASLEATRWRRAHFRRRRDVASLGYERNALASVVVMQHNTEAGDERDVTSLDATHDGGGPVFEGEEMLECISKRCIRDVASLDATRWRRARFRRRRDVASLWATKGMR